MEFQKQKKPDNTLAAVVVVVLGLFLLNHEIDKRHATRDPRMAIVERQAAASYHSAVLEIGPSQDDTTTTAQEEEAVPPPGPPTPVTPSE